MPKTSALVIVLFLLGVGARAQTARGTIQGTLNDETGAVVVGGRVRLIDEGTSLAREQTSNDEGIFEFRALPGGEYTLEAEHGGFKKQVITHIALPVAQTQILRIV